MTLGVQTNWSLCDEWIGIFGFYALCLRQKTCYVLLLIYGYGELVVIWRKNMFYLSYLNLRIEKISE